MFFGAGNAAAVEQTFVERGFTGEREERGQRVLGFCFLYGSDDLRWCLAKNLLNLRRLPLRNPG